MPAQHQCTWTSSLQHRSAHNTLSPLMHTGTQQQSPTAVIAVRVYCLPAFKNPSRQLEAEFAHLWKRRTYIAGRRMVGTKIQMWLLGGVSEGNVHLMCRGLHGRFLVMTQRHPAFSLLQARTQVSRAQ